MIYMPASLGLTFIWVFPDLALLVLWCPSFCEMDRSVRGSELQSQIPKAFRSYALNSTHAGTRIRDHTVPVISGVVSLEPVS
jgi:hypothetical protein